jgi:hypothetical protein
MAVFLSIWGPRQFTPTFWLGIAGWALGLIGNGMSNPKTWADDSVP